MPLNLWFIYLPCSDSVLTKQPADYDLVSYVDLATEREWLILQTSSIVWPHIMISHYELIKRLLIMTWLLVQLHIWNRMS